MLLFKQQFRILAALFSLLLGFQTISAQTLINTKLGGEQNDVANGAVQTPLGDYVMAGYTYSKSVGKADLWVTRIDRNGVKVWEKTLGGPGHDIASDIFLTKEGDFMISGFTTEIPSNVNKAWIVRLDPKGNVKWEQKIGTGKGDKFNGIAQTIDGGFVATGMTRSFSKDNKSKDDVLVVKFDANGRQMWMKTFGGESDDVGNAITVCKTGGMVVVGLTKDKVTSDANMYVIKIDDSGKEVWSKTFGGEKNDEAKSVVELVESKIAVAGWTASKGNGKLDGEVLMLNRDGSLIWDKTYGRSGTDAFARIVKATDGTLATTGYTVPYSATESGLWVVNMDLKGDVIWEKNTTNDKDEIGYAIVPLKEGGFFVAGSTTNETAGGTDMWGLTMTSRGSFKNTQPTSLANNTPKPTPPVVTPPVTTPKPTKPSTPEDMKNMMKPNLYILAVGVSEYSDNKYNLTFAHSDADSIAEMFGTMKGKLFNKVQMRKLLNEDATLVNIKTAISWLESEATQKDMVVMFFSSHGALDNKGNLYLLPYDFSPVSLFATALNIKDITNGINGTPCKKLIFMDACHSGQSGTDLLEFAAIKDVSVDDIVKEISNAEPGICIMTSSSGKEYSYEKKSWGHGAFSKAILEGCMQGKADYNQNSAIDLNELDLYVSERVKDLTGGKQHPFTPIKLFGNIPIFYLK